MLISSVRHGYIWMQQTWKHISEWFTALLEVTRTKNTIATLDGIRAMACLSVIAFHIGLKSHVWDIQILGHLGVSIIMAGDSGVTLFFVLSGFLLFLPYAKSLLFDNAWPSARQFYIRRALRILPGYYISLFLLILLTAPEYLHSDHLKQLVLFLTLFMDSSATTYQRINGPFWTLAVEWQFYLLLPLLALAMRFIVQRGSLQRRVWTLALCLAGLATWGVFSRWAGLSLVAHPEKTAAIPYLVMRIPFFFLAGTWRYGPHSKFLEDFAIGMFSAFCYILARNLPSEGAFNRTLRRLSPWLWGAGILWLLLMALWEASLSDPYLAQSLSNVLRSMYDIWHEIGLSLGFGSILIAVLFGSKGLKSLFEWSPLRWIGLISYSLYIWHLPFIYLYMYQVLPHLHNLRPSINVALYWLWVLFTAIPFSLLFFLAIEKPWMSLSGKLLKHGSAKKRVA